jgi:hypothetical protein
LAQLSVYEKVSKSLLLKSLQKFNWSRKTTRIARKAIQSAWIQFLFTWNSGWKTVQQLLKRIFIYWEISKTKFRLNEHCSNQQPYWLWKIYFQRKKHKKINENNRLYSNIQNWTTAKLKFHNKRKSVNYLKYYGEKIVNSDLTREIKWKKARRHIRWIKSLKVAPGVAQMLSMDKTFTPSLCGNFPYRNFLFHHFSSAISVKRHSKIILEKPHEFWWIQSQFC